MALSVSSVVQLRKVHHAWLVSLPKIYVPATFLCAEHHGLASTTRASIQALDKPVAHRRQPGSCLPNGREVLHRRKTESVQSLPRIILFPFALGGIG